MTPKEKAQELYGKFLNCPVLTDMKAIDAILCAELAVDEIIKYSGTSALYEIDGKIKTVPSGFWQQVKHELDELL